MSFKLKPRMKPEGKLEMYCKLGARLLELRFRSNGNSNGIGTLVARHVPDDMAKEIELRFNAHERLLELADLYVQGKQQEYEKPCSELENDAQFIFDLKHEIVVEHN